MISKRKEVSTGVKGLDHILGSLLLGDNVVWYDESGNLASTFWLRFVRSSLKTRFRLFSSALTAPPKTCLSAWGPWAKTPF